MRIKENEQRWKWCPTRNEDRRDQTRTVREESEQNEPKWWNVKMHDENAWVFRARETKDLTAVQTWQWNVKWEVRENGDARMKMWRTELKMQRLNQNVQWTENQTQNENSRNAMHR